jgi:hypothetical protein
MGKTLKALLGSFLIFQAGRASSVHLRVALARTSILVNRRQRPAGPG